MSDLATAYDEEPYRGSAYWFAHPDHLGLVGALHGIPTVPAPRCRVLEIGCGDGANLLSLAALLPGARLEGLDLSAVHVAAGAEIAAAAGLTNLVLRQGDLMRYEVRPESFDYIIVHGLYSWVPEPVRDALMALVRRALAPHGVALVSYNTLPGQLAFEPVRQLMRFHTADIADPADRIEAALAIANDWCEFAQWRDPGGRGPEAGRVGRTVAAAPPDLVRHDYLGGHERPIWFSDFAAHAARHGLAYVDNVVASAQRPELLDPDTHEMLARLPNPIRVQQYLDHFEATGFRVTLLARDDAPRVAPFGWGPAVALEGRLDPPRGTGAEVVAPRVVLQTSVGPTEVEDLATRVALAIVLERAPDTIDIAALAIETEARLAAFARAGGERWAPPTEGVGLAEHVTEAMRDLWRRDAIHPWRDPPHFLARRAGHPETGLLQRVLAARGAPISSLHHRHCELDEAQRELLAALDGSLDRRALADRFGADTEERLATLREARLLLADPAADPPA